MRKMFILDLYGYFKPFVAALSILVLISTLFVPAAATEIVPVYELVSDEGDLFSDAEEDTLNSELETLSDALGIRVGVATIGNSGGRSDYACAADAYDRLALGQDGIVMLLCITHIPGENFVYILPRGSAETSVSHDELNKMLDAVENKLIKALNGDDDFYPACTTFISYTRNYVQNGEIGVDDDDPGRSQKGLDGFNFGGAILASLLIGLSTAWIVVLVMRGKLRSVKPERTAANYVREGSFALTESREYYLYHRITRIARPKDSGSRGGSRGGGSSRGGGGRHF